MLIISHALIAVCGAATMAAIACGGGSPTSPSTVGATIAGTVVTNAGGSLATASGPAALTVSVPGTALSTGVDGAGALRLGGVPSGNIQLAFSGAGATSTVSLANIADQDVIEL